MALFSKIKGPEALPKHQLWDHTIPLQEGKQPTFRPVYSCLEKELETLCEYLDENLIKEFIQESSSPIKYPILFIPKKNGKLCLYVDYRKLNNITIKNYYPFPCINELIDHLTSMNYYTKLDL